MTISSVIEEPVNSSVEPSLSSAAPIVCGQSDFRSSSIPKKLLRQPPQQQAVMRAHQPKVTLIPMLTLGLPWQMLWQQPAPRHRLISMPSDEASGTESEPEPPVASKSATLSVSSREVFRKYFSEAQPIILPRGHPTVAFNRDQTEQILKVVADETARSSFVMLNSVMMRASRLSLVERAVNRKDERSKSPHPRTPVSDSEGELTSCGSTFAGGSYTSGPDLNESDFWGTENSHELASS